MVVVEINLSEERVSVSARGAVCREMSSVRVKSGSPDRSVASRLASQFPGANPIVTDAILIAGKQVDRYAC